MAKTQQSTPFVLADSLLNAYSTNDKITRYLIENLDDAAWRGEPAGGKGRTIAAVVSHIHNVRVMWLKAAARGSEIPEQLDRHTVTRDQALKALAISHDAIAALLKSSLASEGRIKGFRPDA